MRTVIVLALQALLLCTTCVVAQHIDSSCRTDSNCDSWLACRNGKCTACYWVFVAMLCRNNMRTYSGAQFKSLRVQQ
jgi:hypothetical protein